MYMPLDRPEILYDTQTVASFMQSPTKSAMAELKRLVRHLLGFPQAERTATATGHEEERKRSATGVTEIFGGHPLDAASATQSLVALSRAEFYACNRGTAGGVQTCHFLTEVGLQLLGHTAVGIGVVVAPPLVSTEVRGRQRDCRGDRFGVFRNCKLAAARICF